MQKQAYIEAGRIINTHGVRGEVKIEVWLDSPEYLKSFPRIYLDGRALRLKSGRVQKQFLIAQLEGIESLDAAIALKGKTILIAREDAGLKPGAFFVQDIIGAKVITEDGKELGILEEVLERPASDIYLVRDNEGAERLIPAVPAFIRQIDAATGIITVRLIEGM